MRKYIGIAIIAFIVLALFVAVVYSDGLKPALCQWGLAVGIAAVLAVAGYWISSD